MTGEAGHSARGSPKLGVCVAHELNHLARGLLLGFVILLELVLDVAVGAIDSERGFERKHDFHQALGRDSLEQLNVFVLLLSPFFLAAGRQRIERR